MNTDKPIQFSSEDNLEHKHFAFYLAKGLLALFKLKKLYL